MIILGVDKDTKPYLGTAQLTYIYTIKDLHLHTSHADLLSVKNMASNKVPGVMCTKFRYAESSAWHASFSFSNWWRHKGELW